MSEKLEQTNPEGWDSKKSILVILAHPDDPEFFCGGMIARWCAAGHQIDYCLLTKGQRGWKDDQLDFSEVAKIRVMEQKNAARMLGVNSVSFLEFLDGELFPDLKLRNAIVNVIRQTRPDIVVSCDPENDFPAFNRVNHPDHKAAGKAVVEAVFPAAGNPCYKIESEDGSTFEPHQIEELWLSLTQRGNFAIDLSGFFEIRKHALLCHASQIHEDQEQFQRRLQAKMEKDPQTGRMVYAERFLRIILKRA